MHQQSEREGVRGGAGVGGARLVGVRRGAAGDQSDNVCAATAALAGDHADGRDGGGEDGTRVRGRRLGAAMKRRREERHEEE